MSEMADLIYFRIQTQMLPYLIFVFISVSGVLSGRSCYWNAQCSFQLYSSKTPYDTVRGDIRDQPNLPNCEAVSAWTLNRHGNRNPGDSVIDDIKVIIGLKDEIISSYEAGSSQLCSQDIENLRRWSWNETIDASASFLTGTGYEELYGIGKRLREKYPQLLPSSNDSYYFRTTNEQRTVTSSKAFVHGFTDNTNLSLSVDGPWDRDDLIRPYENCEKYQVETKASQELDDQLTAYYSSAEFIAVQNNVQQRLGINTKLSSNDIYSIYELCRFDRSWTPTLKSPWCSVFTDDDLVVLEYEDDVWHYYRNGYGSWVNVRLGGPVLKDMFDNFEAVVQGGGRKIVSYFTHDTMLEMTFSALGLYKDDFVLEGIRRQPNRKWRTSYISSFSVNIIAVLNRCHESDGQSYRVQLFVNEDETELCPPEGCTWEEFERKFASYTSSLDFCSLDYANPNLASLSSNARINGIGPIVFLIQLLIVCLWR
ncbi:multiple inositol polyphosphate phosphatase 1-like [Galleria mellonella]|uniref:Multiple inositol polyphosphate phosphatase 1 n=1 Tax=Galleria mellonella TaxID=7137 RepID=A0ABM3N3M6_GALME|nr:multiple inositol polyphosphate phosphatase 1-like [Galleria mellonella]